MRGCILQDIFNNFLTEICVAKTDEKIWKVLCDTVSEFGFNNVVYLAYPKDFDHHNLSNIPIDCSSFPTQPSKPKNMFRHNNGISIPVIQNHLPFRIDTSQASSLQLMNTFFEYQKSHEDITSHLTGKIYGHKLFCTKRGEKIMAFISDNMDSSTFTKVSKEHAPLLSAIIYISHAYLSENILQTNKVDIPKLSPRQKDVLSNLASGLKYKQIAFNLGISKNTVGYHMAELRKKLACSNTSEVLAAAYRYGLIT